MTRPRDIADSINRINSSAADATAMTIDSSENVGVGITSSLEKFTVANTSSGIVGRFTNNINQTLDLGITSGSGSAGGAYLNNANSGYLAFQSGSSERLRITAAGDVGIGVTPVTLLHVHENSTNDAEIHMTNTSSGATASDGLTIFANEGSAGLLYRENNALRFFTNGSEVGRFNSTGEFAVGTTGTSGMVFVQSTGSSKPTVYSLASNTSFTGVMHRIRCATAASSSFFPIFVESGNGSDTEFYVRGNGNVNADGTFSGGGADYAEMFEWDDGNSDNEDRRGYSVVLTNGNKIRKATSDDTSADIIGIVSGAAMIIGDTESMKWQDKYLKDDFGNYVLENYTVTNWTEGETKHSYETDKIPSDVTVPEDAVVSDRDDNSNELKRRRLNPDYDDTQTYIPRDQRKEWDAIGMMGKLRMRSGQPTGDRWIKMRDITSDIEEWLVR